MRTTRRGLIGIGVGAAATAILAACGQSATPTAVPAKPAANAPAAAATKPAAGAATAAKPDVKPAAQAPSKGGQALVAFTSQGNKDELDMFDRIWDGFEKRKPNIKVDRKYDPALTWPKVINQLRSGTASDVIRTNDDDIFLLLSANVVTSLDDYVRRDLKRDEYYPVVWQSRTGPGGEIGSALVGTAPMVMFYNVDLFQKAGVKPPTDWEKDNWTMDDFESALAKVSKKSGGRVEVFGWESPSYWWQVGLWNEGLDWYNEDETKATANTPEARKALERYQRWHKEGWAVPPGENGLQLFNSGLLAMVFNDASYEVRIKPEINWDVAPIFRGAKRDGAFHNDRNFTIPASSKNRDEAWELVKWLFSMDGEDGGQAEFAKLHWGVPVLKKAAEGPLFANAKSKGKRSQIHFQAVNKSWPIPDNPMGEAFQVVWRRSDPMFIGQETPEKFLTDAEELLNRTIKQVGWSKKNNQRGYRLEGAIEKAGRLEDAAPAQPAAKPGAPATKPATKP